MEAEFATVSETRGRAIETWQAKSHHSEELLAQCKAELKQSENGLAKLRKDYKEERDKAADASKHSSNVVTELEAYEEKIEQLEFREKEVSTELHRVTEQTQHDNERFTQEIETQRTIAAASQVELEQIKHSAVADVESVKNELLDHQNELAEVKVAAKIAKKERDEIEDTMNDVVKGLKEEVMTATGNMEGAAMAGLGLQEMIAKLHADHDAAVTAVEEALAAAQTETEGVQVELADVSAQLEERNTMLTGVMDFMEQQQQGSEDAEGDEGEESGGGLQGMLDRSARQKEALEAHLSEFEEENGRLTQELSKTTKRLDEVVQAKRELQTALDTTAEARDGAAAELAEKSNLLERVMGMVKKRGTGDSADPDHEGNEDFDPNDPLAGIEQLEDQIKALLDANRTLEADKTKLKLELMQLKESHERLGQQCSEQRDEMEVMSARVLELADAKTVGATLKEALGEGEKARAKLREENDKLRATISALEKERSHLQDDLADTKAELQNLRDELAQSMSDAEAAAMGGLSLMEMLNKLKSDHEAEIKRLEGKIAALETQLADKDAAMGRLADMLGGEEDAENALAMLELRLKRQLTEAQAMEATIAEYEDTMEQQTTTIAELNGVVDGLKADIVALKKKLADAVEELQNLDAGIQQAFVKTKRPEGGGDWPEGEEPPEPEKKMSVLDLIAEIESLTAALLGREQELEAAVERHGELTQIHKEAMQEILRLKDELEAEQERAAGLDKALQRMTKKYESAEERLAQMTKYRDQLSDENKKLMKQLQKMEHLNEKTGQQHDATIADLQARLDSRVQRIRHLEDKLVEKLSELTNTQDFLRKIALRTWEDDGKVEECTNCDDDFTLMNRRHHCRICGKVFCKICSSYKVQTTSKKKPVRSCAECHSFMALLQVHDKNKSSLSAIHFEEKKVELVKDKTGRSGFNVDITPEMPPLKGVIVMVSDVESGGLADGQLKPGDKLISINGVSARELSEKKAFKALQAEKLTIIVQTPTPMDDTVSLVSEDGSDAESLDPRRSSPSTPSRAGIEKSKTPSKTAASPLSKPRAGSTVLGNQRVGAGVESGATAFGKNKTSAKKSAASALAKTPGKVAPTPIAAASSGPTSALDRLEKASVALGKKAKSPITTVTSDIGGTTTKGRLSASVGDSADKKSPSPSAPSTVLAEGRNGTWEIEHEHDAGGQTPVPSTGGSKADAGGKTPTPAGVAVAANTAVSSKTAGPPKLPEFEASPTDVQITPAEGRTVGIVVGTLAGTLVVARLTKGALADETGKITLGMKITSVNSKSTVGMSRDQCIEAMDDSSEDVLDLGLAAPLVPWVPPASICAESTDSENTHNFLNTMPDSIDSPLKPKPMSLPLTLFEDNDNDGPLADDGEDLFADDEEF